MSLADTSLYYPFIRIPEPTLVHSLLFKDGIKRIIPPHAEMDNDRVQQAERPSNICKQYLGYEFIESADYWLAREEIAEMFCSFLDAADTTQRPEHFTPLLGPDYKVNLVYTPNTYSSGTQYFVYAHKFDHRVFETIEALRWMKYHEEENACEMRNELCNLYVTVLASCISKQTREPVCTGLIEAEELLRKPVFLEYFRDAVPPQMQDTQDGSELCINLLLSHTRDSTRNVESLPPAHKILTLNEAVRIRAGLEEHRQHFCRLVDDLIRKAEAVRSEDENAYMSLEVKEVTDAAEDYANRIERQAEQELTRARKGALEHFRTGFSAAVPLLGVAADALTGNTPAPGLWTAAGSILAVGTHLLPKGTVQQQAQQAATSRQQAFLFMNRLWGARDARLPVA